MSELLHSETVFLLLTICALAVVTVIGIGGMYLYTKSVSDRLDMMRNTIDSTLNSQGQVALRRMSLAIH